MHLFIVLMRGDHPSLSETSAIKNVPHFTQAAVYKGLSILDTAKGPGPDQLHLFMLQILADLLAEPITALFNKSLQSGEVSQGGHKTIICPIFKKGDLRGAASYRPVSLTSGSCKIFKKMLKRAFLLFLTWTWSFSPNQYGFFPRSSCLSSLLL